MAPLFGPPCRRRSLPQTIFVSVGSWSFLARRSPLLFRYFMFVVPASEQGMGIGPRPIGLTADSPAGGPWTLTVTPYASSRRHRLERKSKRSGPIASGERERSVQREVAERERNRERKCADTIGTVCRPFRLLKYKDIFQIKYTEAILSNSTRKL